MEPEEEVQECLEEYLALLALLLPLGVLAPPAAPLLQSVLGLRCQAAGERLVPLQTLDQTQAGIHTGQVVLKSRQAVPQLTLIRCV
ncbi:hypothetical protein F7725_004673 [Dissostichus mawsoni]|uniref:Uncharacterized protein n=1 Tax=Dissostichus mawsoni TaxID=36200 RepID=A0A7J5XKV9_DISMA|nr:hypothetical protein F7725_004673 [Dissostichus mawsoni]